MHHKERFAPIELHIRPGEQRDFITVEEAWAGAVPVEAPGLKMVALSPAHRLMHNIFHSEVQDSGYAVGSVCLRQLSDLATISARYSDTLDWGAIGRSMRRHRMDHVFRARMRLAVELLGAPCPGVRIAGLRPRLHLEHCLLELRSPRLAGLTRWFAGVAGPLKRHHLDLLYHCGTGGLSLQVHRARHIGRLLIRHRTGLMSRVAKRGQSLQ